VVLSEATYASLTSGRKSLIDHILEAPLWPDDLVDAVNARERDEGREIGF
jgi:hypothetical protein